MTDHTPPPTPDSVRLQILATEHWSLLASRSLAWNESWARSGMFLTTLSGAIVALALVSQASDFGESFRLFGLVILPVVLFVGVTTLLRLDASNYHDAQCVIGMNRIRSAYLKLAPELEQYFVMGTTDDEPGLLKTMALGVDRPTLGHFLSATPFVIATLNSLLAGGICALIALESGGGRVAALIVGGVAFLAAQVFQATYASRRVAGLRARHVPLFPTDASS